MKKYLKSLLAFGLITSVYSLANAQNLVLNPSFEITSSNCGNLGGEGINEVTNWDDANSNQQGDSCSSPDLFSVCNTLPFIGGPGPTNMPNSALGYQYSRTGTRHAGIITYAPGLSSGCSPIGSDNYREYIEGKTSSPLVGGQTYCVSMYVSLANGVTWGSNNIGIYFTNTLFQRDACLNGNSSIITGVTPQLNYTCAPIVDTTNWVRLQWDYTAVGGEQFFTIGNFFNNANTTTACSNSNAGIGNPYAYYFIDDVSITANSCCSATVLPIPNKCTSDAIVALSAIAPSGVNCTPTLNGTWSGPGVSGSNFNPATAGAGTHTITYTLPCGFSTTVTVTVNVCATLNICQESNGALTVTGGTSPYTWQSSAVTTDCSSCFFGQCNPINCPGVQVTTWTTYSSLATATPPSTLPIRVRDNSVNVVTITTLAGIPACGTTCNITLSTTGGGTTCGQNNGTATTNVTAGTGPYTYAWNNGGSSASISNLAAGTYSVTVTGSGGCTATGSYVVASSTGIVAAASGTATTCGNSNGTASINVTTGTGPFDYAWNTGGNSASLSNLTAGNYSVTVTGAGGCTATGSATVAASTAVTLTNSSTNTTCGNNNGSASATVATGVGPFTYSWNNGGSSSAITSLAPGTYNVTVTGANGCSASGSAVVNASTGITVTTSNTNANCGQSTGSVAASVTGATGNVTYSWNTSPVQTSATATNLPAGTYTVIVSDAGGCQGTNTASISNFGAPETSIASSSSPACYGVADGTATVSASGGNGTLSYTWNTNPVQTGPTATGLIGGNYICTVVDQSGCQAAQAVTLNAPTQIVPNGTVTAANCGNNDGCITLAPSGGSGNYAVVWNNSSTGLSYCNIAGGDYSATVTDGSGCSITQAYTVQTNGGPQASLTGQSNVNCNGAATGTASALAVGSGTFNYSWNTIPVQTTATATNLRAGTYICTVSSPGGCSTQVTATIQEPSAISASASVVKPICTASNGSIQLNPIGGTPNYTYVWANGLGISSGIQNQGAGTYPVTITDASGCALDTAFTLTALPGNFVVTISNIGGTISTNGGVSFQWYYNGSPIPNQTGQTFDYTESGSYYVVATDANGCIDQSNTLELTKTSVEEEVINSMIIFPNPATDRILIEGPHYAFSQFTIQIFSSNGQMVFQKEIGNTSHISIAIPVQDFSKGVYLIKLSNGSSVRTERIMVEK